jgi:DNA excision repair protein ERCC-2
VTEVRLSVRELAEFCHRSGDIDYRFTPSPSAEEGIAGHQRLQRRRGEHYQPEYPLESVFEDRDLSVRLSGRADGFDARGPLLEEIKTCRVQRQSIPPAVESLHWAQLMLYGGLLCREQASLETVELQLTYFNVDSGEEWPRLERLARSSLLGFLEDSLSRIGEWLERQQRWRHRRDSSLAAMAFPYDGYRRGQRPMAELVYQCISRGGRLLLEAPTGTGKTAAVLFPALKALATGRHDRVCFVTARTVGRRTAEDALRDFEAAGMQLRRLSVTAKESICFSPGRACHGEDCPFARGYYDRLPKALDAAMSLVDLDRNGIERIAREHEVCPYQLGMDLLPWVDLCIGDIHYIYSFSGSISSCFQERRLRWTVLLDEAHNLPGRARDMYSATLSKQLLMSARGEAGGQVLKALDACNRVMLALNREDWQERDFDSRSAPPDLLEQVLQRFVGAVSEQQATAPLAMQRSPALQEYYFAVLHFQRVLERYGPDYRFEMTRTGERQSLVLRLRCLDASRLLGERQRQPLAVTAFSATASPARWMLDELGFDEKAVYRSLPSPFAAEQLRVELDTSLDIRFRYRQASLPGLVARIRRWLIENPGNCIVYFSAYRYMEDTLAQLGEHIGERYLCVQGREWGEAQRSALLDMLRQRRDVAAFCILGGVFGEGIDLPGDALKSVVVVGVGLPQFNREREALQLYYQEKLGRGFEYAFQFPGMQRVSQALGRVIRQDQDSGRALLIDSRYRDRNYRALLPPCWTYDYPASPGGDEVGTGRESSALAVFSAPESPSK